MSLMFFLVLSTDSIAIFKNPDTSDVVYKNLSKPFDGVFQIRVLKTGNGNWSYGTCSYVYHPDKDKFFILTAAHVVKDAARIELVTNNGILSLSNPSFFNEWLIDKFKDAKMAISFENAPKGKRLFGGRINNDQMEEAIYHYGGDLAILRMPQGWSLPVKPLIIANSYNIEDTESHIAVGFGVGGDVGRLGTYTGNIYGSGTKRAYHPELQTGILIKGTDLKNGDSWQHTSWLSTLDESKMKETSGQLGYGDSGGPLIAHMKDGRKFIIGVISSTLPAAKNQDFIEKATMWQKLFLKLGKGAESGSYSSYVLGQESNIYGSEGLFSGVTSLICHEWINSFL